MATSVDYSKKTREELIAICKEKHIKGYSGKKKVDILELLKPKVSAAQDTGKFRKNTKDQFYTSPAIAKQCCGELQKHIPDVETYLWIEPSAGNGSFLGAIPNGTKCIALDIDPQAEGIQQADFLTWTPPTTTQNILLFGNPPFGRQSSLAKAFLGKGCGFANAIAFILPKSFVKPSMTNCIPKHFHCILTKELDKNAFLCNGTPYDVPCVFQIWVKKDTDRTVQPKVKPIGFQYVSADKDYHIAFRRVGGLAGTCYKKGDRFSPQSHYFLRLDAKYVPHIDELLKKVNAHTFPSNTVGPRSLSQTEANIVLNRLLSELSCSAGGVLT